MDGQYIADAKGGVPVGDQLVRINAYRSGSSNNNDDLLTAETNRGGGRVQYLPPEYNEVSQLVVTIKGDDAEFIQNFRLEKEPNENSLNSRN